MQQPHSFISPHVLLVPLHPLSGTALQAGLVEAGCIVSHVGRVTPSVAGPPTLLVLEGPLAPHHASSVRALRKLHPDALLVIACGSDPCETTLARALQAELVLPHTMPVDALVWNALSLRALAEQRDQLRTELADRKVIERAKWLIMQRAGVTEEQAYAILRRTSQDRSRTMRDIADAVLLGDAVAGLRLPQVARSTT